MKYVIVELITTTSGHFIEVGDKHYFAGHTLDDVLLLASKEEAFRKITFSDLRILTDPEIDELVFKVETSVNFCEFAKGANAIHLVLLGKFRGA